MKRYNKSIFIFRLDLRFDDNTAFIQAIENSNKIIFVYLKENLSFKNIKNNNYKNFLLDSLEILDNNLKKLYKTKIIFLDKIKDLNIFIKKENINAVFLNKLYIEKYIKQEDFIKKLCVKSNINFNIYHDFLLHEILSIKPASALNNKNNICAYKVFTPFFNKARNYKVLEPVNIKKILNLEKNNPANNILRNLGNFKNYKKTRDYPAISNGTTRLSCYINTGAVSIRRVYYSIIKLLGKDHELIRQLYWREFYYNLYYAYPEMFYTTLKNRKFNWSYNKNIFKKWTQGKTGVPIVDAAMQELNTTGFMHNRCRMIVANFLTMVLKIDWKMGEKYFAQKLKDYDPVLNNGNWQYMAQVGADTAGYLRILNPYRQQKKFDSKQEYIKSFDVLG